MYALYSTTVKVLSEHLELPKFTGSNLSFCKRLGEPKNGKEWVLPISRI